MKPIIIAKRLWEKCKEIQASLGTNISYGPAPLYSYPGILTLFAAAQGAVESKDEEWIRDVNSYLEKYPFEFEEPGIKFGYNFENYRVGGLGKGWMMMHGYFKDHEAVLREYAEKTFNGPLTHDGIVTSIKPKNRGRVWIDVAFCVCPFMIYAGLVLNEPKYIDYAVDQCFKMYDLLMDKSNGLLHQARGFMADPEKISADHWSRGNGWGIIGLVELVRYLPHDHKDYPEACKRLQDQCTALIKYQTVRGLWGQEITEPLSWEESSGTGLILYAMGIGIRLGVLDKETFMEPFKRGIDGLYQFCIDPDYSVTRGCQGCLCPEYDGEKGTIRAYILGKTHVKNDSHTFGPIILAMIEAHRNGIINIEK